MADLNPKWPKTLDEAVEVLTNMLTEEDLCAFRETSKVGGKLQWRLTIYIQNNFGLREGNQELLESCAYWVEENPLSILPEVASTVIIWTLRQKLRSWH